MQQFAKQTIQLDVAVNSVCEGLGAKKIDLLQAAKARFENGIAISRIDGDISYQDLRDALASNEASTWPAGHGFFLVPWKCDAENERIIKEECRATIQCYPFEANDNGDYVGRKCFYCGEDATQMALFGRAF